MECPAYGWRTQPCSTPPSHGVVCSSVTCCRVGCRSGKIGLFGVSPNKLLNKQSNCQRFETPCHNDLPWYTMKEVTGCENRSYMFLSNHLTKRSFFLQNGLRYLLTHFPKIDTHFDLRSYLLHSLKTSWCQLCRQWWVRTGRQSWLHDNSWLSVLTPIARAGWVTGNILFRQTLAFCGTLQRITVTSWWARWRLKSLASELCTQPFVQAQIKENIKALGHWP